MDTEDLVERMNPAGVAGTILVVYIAVGWVLNKVAPGWWNNHPTFHNAARGLFLVFGGLMILGLAMGSWYP